MLLNPGDILSGHYRIEAEIGRGAYGRVYRARETKLDRPVAIKELARGADDLGSAQFADYVRRFEREAKVQANLNHPNIVHVYELIEGGDDQRYLVMEYVDGENLRRILDRRGQLPVDEAVRITADILAGLAAVHADPRDIVHRDIKPSNVLLTKTGQAKLADFGLAQVGDESMRSEGGKSHPGTQLYMSPEQGSTSDYLYSASDIFSVGCVLFEMLTGIPYKHARRDRKELTGLRPDAPPWLTQIVVAALAKDPDDRPANAAEMAAALRDTCTPTPPEKVGLLSLFKWRWLSLILTLGLAALAGSLLLRQYTPSAKPIPGALASASVSPAAPLLAMTAISSATALPPSTTSPKLGPTSTRSATTTPATIPSLTPTTEPTATSRPTVAFVPAVPATALPTQPPLLKSQLLMYADFSDPRTANWDNYSSNEGTVGYEDGHYFIENTSLNFYGLWKQAGLRGDVALQVDVLGPSWPEGAAFQGIAFGWQPGWQGYSYFFAYSPTSGECWFGESEGKKANVWGESGYTPVSFDNHHILRVYIEGGKAIGYVDGVYCTEHTLTHYKPGYVGVVGRSRNDVDKFYFDDFYLYRWP